MLNLRDINKDNCYSYISELIRLVLEETATSMHDFTDICLAICVADENVGTNRIELDVDKFFRIDDAIWENLFSKECVCKNTSVSPLPKVQKLRVVADAMMLCLLKEGKEFRCSFNCEASKSVASVLGIDDARGTQDDKTIDGVFVSLAEIRDIFVNSEVEDTVVKKLAIFTNEVGAKIKLRGTVQLPLEYEPIIGKAFSNIEYRDIEYTSIMEKAFIKELNDTLIQDLLGIGTLNTAYYIVKVKSVIPNKYLLCLTYEVYRKLFTNKRLSNTLSMIFNFSIESTSDIKSTCVLLLIMYCGTTRFTNMLFRVAKGDI